ncbi:MAG: hypothetical protein HY913_08635 [Desulfomonile tiedjei]|nr:hypothetical protein [Desulfomonile tiedjei]
MNRWGLLITVLGAATLLIVFGFFSFLSGQNSESLPATECLEEQIEPLQWGDPDSDLASCEQQCRSRYGVDQYTLQAGGGGGGGYSGGYYVYARCIASCNKRFWNNFDRRMDEIGRQ